MGSFTEKFRLNQRLRNSDFERSETVQHWKLWAEDILKRAGYVEKVDNVQEDKLFMENEQEMKDEQTNNLVDPIEKL